MQNVVGVFLAAVRANIPYNILFFLFCNSDKWYRGDSLLFGFFSFLFLTL